MVTTQSAETDRTELGVEWFRRTAGPEERVEATDLLAALKLRDGTAGLVFIREGVHSAAIDILGRAAGEPWHLRWSSDGLSCGG